MNGFSFLMFVFATSVLLVGTYMFTGREFRLVSWREPFKDIEKNGWKTIGEWTIISSIFIFIIGIIGLFFEI